MVAIPKFELKIYALSEMNYFQTKYFHNKDSSRFCFVIPLVLSTPFLNIATFLIEFEWTRVKETGVRQSYQAFEEDIRSILMGKLRVDQSVSQNVNLTNVIGLLCKYKHVNV